jgi:hypothetical protein
VLAVVAVVAVVAAIAFGVGDQRAGERAGAGVRDAQPSDVQPSDVQPSDVQPSDVQPSAGATTEADTGSSAPTKSPAATPDQSASTAPASAGPPDRAPAEAAAALDVIVLDSTSTQGLGTDMSLYLARAGWFLLSPGVYSPERETTTIFYPDGYEDVARALAPFLVGLDGTQVQPNPPGAPTDSLTVVLGTDATAWSPPA